MLRNAKKLERCELRAPDGKIGHVDDFLFDDWQWKVRYMVVDTGNWLNQRRVLVSPAAFGPPEFERHMIPVRLTRDQVRRSPPVETAQPVSREEEAQLAQYYNWPLYWASTGFADPGFVPPILPADFESLGGSERGRYPARRRVDDPAAAGTAAPDPHQARSIRNVCTYGVEASDGAVGHVDDVLIDDRTWEVRYLVVAMRNGLPGKRVLIAPAWIEEVDWEHARVNLRLTRAAIKGSPGYDPAEPVSAEYTSHLHDYYGQRRP